MFLPAPSARSRRPAALAVLIAVCAGAGCGTNVTAEPPAPAWLETLDEAIRSAISNARARVVDEPRDATSWGELGMVYEATGLHELAAQCYAEARRLDVRESRWPYRSAVVLGELGRTSEAITTMRDAIDVFASHAPAHWRLGMWSLDGGDLDGAVAAFEAARALDRTSPAALAGLARVHLQRDVPDRAIEVLGELLAAHPQDRYAHFLLGDALRAAGRWSEAEREIAIGVGAAPAWSDPWQSDVDQRRVGIVERRQAAKRALAEGRTADAIAGFEALAAERPEDVGALQNLALAYATARRFDDALARLANAEELEPENVWTHVNLADVARRAGRSDLALTHVDRAIALRPGFGRAHELRGAILRAAKRTPDALDAFQAALDRDQRNASLRLLVGELELELGRFTDAVRTFEAALAAAPTAAAHCGIALANLKLGAFADAESALERAEALRPEDTTLVRKVRAELERRRAEGR